MLHDRAIDRPEETNRVGVLFVGLASVAVKRGQTRSACARVDRAVFSRQLVAESLRDGSRDVGCELDLIERMSVSLQKSDSIEAEREHLKSVHRLKESPQGLGVKAVGHHRQLTDPLRNPDRTKEPRCPQNDQAIERVVPELGVAPERFEGLEQHACLGGRIVLTQRGVELLHEIPEPDGVLLVLGMPAMGRLVQGQTRRLCFGRNSVEHVVRETEGRGHFGHDASRFRIGSKPSCGAESQLASKPLMSRNTGLVVEVRRKRAGVIADDAGLGSSRRSSAIEAQTAVPCVDRLRVGTVIGDARP